MKEEVEEVKEVEEVEEVKENELAATMGVCAGSAMYIQEQHWYLI